MDDVKNYGFKDEQELARATLGNPYQVFVLSPEAVQAYQPGQHIASILTQEPRLEFPVLVDGQARSLLTVVQLDGRWQIVGFGAFPNSQKLVQLQERLAKTNAVIKLIRFDETWSTFALVEQDNQAMLIHLSSLPGLFKEIDRDNLTPYKPQDFMPKVRKAFEERVAAEQTRQKHENSLGQPYP